MWEPNNAEEIVAIMAAIPGDTNRHKLAWVQNAKAGIYACACGGNCDKGADAAADIGCKCAKCEIVKNNLALTLSETETATRAMANALSEIEEAIEHYKNGSALSRGNGPYAMAMIATIVAGVK